MLNVKKESFPGSLTETVTGNANIGESGLVYVVTDLLDAGENALSNAYNSFDELVTSRGLLGFLGEVQEDDFDEFDHGNDESTGCNTSSVVDVSKFERIQKLSLSLSLGVGVEVVSGSSGHDHKLGRVGPPSHDPEDSEEHTKGDTFERSGPFDRSVLWDGKSTRFDLVQSNNTCKSVHPNKEGNQIKNDVKNWNNDDSLVLNSEVSSGIDNIDSLGDVFPSTHNADAEAAPNGSKTNASN